MTPRRFALLFVVAVLGGCYRPSIKPGGLMCADGGACPEGFHCGNDKRCHPGNMTMCLPDAAVATLCNDQPLGEQCDPICQQGCDCGRCNLDGDKLACVPPGNKLRGDFCNLGNDDCAAGLVCLQEPCSPESADAGGSRLGRCYRYCAGDQHCDGTSCNVPIVTAAATSLLACQLPPRTCNPVGGSNTCGNALLGCYVDSGGDTFCECPGTSGDAEPCGVFTSCVPGFRCVQQGGGATPRCRQVCRLGGSDCASGAACTGTPGDTMFGYCAP
jgi:hypothetical protein